MKRKYPVSFFLLGVLGNLIRYLLIGLTGLVLLIIGVIGVPACKIIGMIVLACYLLLGIIEQFLIRSASLKESDNPEFNQFMDTAFGATSPEGKALPFHERIAKAVEGKTKSQDADLEE